VDFITKYLFSENDIHQFGLFPCPYISGLYTKKSTHHAFDRRIDIKETEHRQASAWQISDALSRDFTVCALFCNAHGEILDPTCQGIDDVRRKILRTIGCAETSLKEDPVRILRAVKYMSIGYKPAHDLACALKEWNQEITSYTAYQREHLHAVTRKLLLRPDATQIVNLLGTYGLLKKLYNFSPDSDSNLVQKLGKMLSRDAALWQEPPRLLQMPFPLSSKNSWHLPPASDGLEKFDKNEERVFAPLFHHPEGVNVKQTQTSKAEKAIDRTFDKPIHTNVTPVVVPCESVVQQTATEAGVQQTHSRSHQRPYS